MAERSAPRDSQGAGSTAHPAIRLGPVLAFIAIWLGGSWLVVGTLLRPLLPGGWLAVGAVAALFVVPVTMLARAFSGGRYPSGRTRLLIFRPFWYLMLYMPLLAVAGTVGVLAGLPFGAGPAAGVSAVLAAAALLALASLAGYRGTRQLVVKRLDVRLPRLPEAFDGTRVVQISDLHVGPHTSRRHLARIADAARHARPDLLVHTGDQVDDHARDVEYFTAAVGDLAAPLGVFAVAGNHDVIAGWDGVRQGLSAAGIRVLVNEAVPVERGGARLWVAGTGDPAGASWHRGGGANAAPDIERTLAGIPPDQPILALAHNPVLWPDLAGRGVDLTLSGHTHYGQLAIPDWGWSIASSFLELSMGAHRRERSLLYINPGTNYWGIPFRIGTPPEITVLTLRRTERDAPPSITPSVTPGDELQDSTRTPSRRSS